MGQGERRGVAKGMAYLRLLDQRPSGLLDEVIPELRERYGEKNIIAFKYRDT